MTINKPTVAALVLLGSCVLPLAGCENVGNENPISPDRMQQMRKEEANQRANFQPKGGPPPTAGQKK
ncbi:hypothetical protein [Fimbriimonas ginsengisoli]|uniref:Lipoprotein n=1 Tax=Fimbriimonas ginsengisoli Gsoil 348 TaxID=661478 RepID=A0A068NS62_FIMGI|nr:hypothetical protein [Fimbriimonas ginsengisoli]AIE85575.1 hypothetical protein OP10G_2207 [Fimbriimonas ginsengisoli Gsoil 348]